MTLASSVVVPGNDQRVRRFRRSARNALSGQWEAPSRCTGWRVADVAAHVVGQLADVTAFRLDGLGTPEVTARQVDERRGATPRRAGRRTPDQREEPRPASSRASTKMPTSPKVLRATGRPSDSGWSRCGSTRTSTPTTSAAHWASRPVPRWASRPRCRTFRRCCRSSSGLRRPSGSPDLTSSMSRAATPRSSSVATRCSSSWCRRVGPTPPP